MINYLEDRDLWRKTLPLSDEFTINLRSYPQEFEVWDEIARRLESQPSSFLNGGAGIQRYYRVQVEALKAQSYRAMMQQGVCAAINASYTFASELANEIIPLHDGALFGLSYFQRADGRWQYSLRSRDDFDVSVVAKIYGGGGHQKAAGFEADYPVHGRIG